MASPGPTVFVVDDDEGTRWVLTRALQREGLGVVDTPDPAELFRALEAGEVGLVLLDVRLGGQDGLDLLARARQRFPRTPVIVVTAYGTMETAVEAMKRGAFDYLVKPLDVPEVVAVVRRALASGHRGEPGPGAPAAEAVPAVVGKSPRMQEVCKAIGRVAGTDATVLIQGESGTGKELFARAIHRHSRRAGGPFVPVDCAAIPANLLESELFGHERGAFTHAFARRRGRFELAEGGTLFLDEAGEMPLDLQAKLLRVLQERTVQRLGGVEPIEVDVRIVAATNRDLGELTREGRFRQDLYYRLHVLSLTLPPLRERREDIPLLVDHFLGKYAPGLGVRRVSPEAMEALLWYGWPGNVRELENALHRALVMARAETIELDELPAEVRRAVQAGEADPSLERVVEQHLRGLVTAHGASGQGRLYARVLPLVERTLPRLALQETRGNQLRAARLLGINRNTLRKRVGQLGLAIPRGRTSPARTAGPPSPPPAGPPGGAPP